MIGSSRQARRWLLAAGILVAFAVRGYRLDGQALWSDEDITLDRSQKPIAEIVATLPVEQAPLYPLLLRGWTIVAGTSDWSLRFPSLLFGVLAVPLGYAVARRLAGSREALILAWLLALHPYLVWYGQEARMYTLLLALGLATIAAVLVGEGRQIADGRIAAQLVRHGGSRPSSSQQRNSEAHGFRSRPAPDKPDLPRRAENEYTPVHELLKLADDLFRRVLGGLDAPLRSRLMPWLAAGVLAALTVYTHYFGALVVFVLASWALVDARRGRPLRPWLVAALSALVIYAPWIGRSLGVLAFSGWRAPTTRAAALAGDLVAWTAGRTLNGRPQDVAVGAMLLLAGIGVFRWWRELGGLAAGREASHPTKGAAPARDPLRALLWLAVPAAIGLALLARSTDSDPRYFMGILPAFYLAVAAGLVKLRRPARLGGAALLLALAALGLARLYGDPAVQKQAFRPFLATVEAAAGHEDTVLFLDGPALGMVRRYEQPRSAVKVVNLKSSGNQARDREEIAARMAELAAEYPHLWLAEDGEATGLGASWLDEHARPISSQGFQSITLRRYEIPR